MIKFIIEQMYLLIENTGTVKYLNDIDNQSSFNYNLV